MNKTPTYDEVIAMRADADRSERIFNKIGREVSAAVNGLRFIESELIVAKRKKKTEMIIALRMARDEAQAAVDATEQMWHDQLNKHDELWAAYCEALEAFRVAEEAAEASCGERECDCKI